MSIAGNLLDPDTESLETSVGGWINATNATVSRSTAIGGYDGSAALKLTAIATGFYIGALHSGNTAPSGFVAATSYTASMRARAGSTSRTVSLKGNWYQSDGTFISASTFNGGVAVSSAAWVSVSGTVTSPALAARLELFWSTDGGAAAEAFYGDYFCVRTSSVIPVITPVVTTLPRRTDLRVRGGVRDLTRTTVIR